MFYPCNPASMSISYQGFGKLERDPDWIAELSMRGIRCLAHHLHNRIDLWTRDRMRITAPLVELRRQIKDMIPDQTILDGVLVGESKVKDHYFVFDIPRFKGIDSCVPLLARTILLRILYQNQPLIKISEQTDKKLLLYYESIKMRNINGIILKCLHGNYIIGTKKGKINPEWIKVAPEHNIILDLLKS